MTFSAVHGPGQVLGKDLAGALQGSGGFLGDGPAVADPHPVEVEQQLHAGVLGGGLIDLVGKVRGVAGVHVPEGQGDELVGTVVFIGGAVIILHGLGNIAALAQARSR